jgi:hypothetical protein
MEYQQHFKMKNCVVPEEKLLTLKQEGENTPTSAALNIRIFKKHH